MLSGFFFLSFWLTLLLGALQLLSAFVTLVLFVHLVEQCLCLYSPALHEKYIYN